jgi:SAM-dependent methyltransferase
MEAYWWIIIYMVLILILVIVNSIVHENIVEPFIKEGFESSEPSEAEISGATNEDKGIVRYIGNEELYDTFYASIYDKLTQGAARTQAEVGLILHEWSKRGDNSKTFEVLDAGCGTGIAVCSFAKFGVKRVVGIDKSSAMIKQSKETTLPATTLTDDQKKIIEWRNADLINPSACSGGEFTHAILLYFTVYYFTDKETLFRNLYFWVKPGGKLVVHVVNKHKFDPMLDSASPWIGLSLQKYSEKRVKKSEVTFNKFKYVGEFDIQDPTAEFRETFRFNDGKIRRQKHSIKIENTDEIVGMAKAAGWEYLGYTDLVVVGFEYAYHLHFKHP